MLIISASSVMATKEKSQSLGVARKVREGLRGKGIPSEIADLRELRIEMCTMCEGCREGGGCVQSDDFNKFNDLWRSHDRAIIVCPHYAGIPAKLIAIIEKMQEMSYLGYCQGKPVKLGKDVTIVAHGGMTEGYEDGYKANLILPLSNMLKSIGCTIRNDAIEETLCFGVKRYFKDKDEGSVCFRKEDDDERVDRIIAKAIDGIEK